ncbi:M20 metallopeptidase family protein [Blautia sp. HCP3S3_G3]|uniref:M20 metallopeptidase family protein n=1 Tax=Blautia sp. HCP3S3_G3 TaxID=3438913 RepID=UPI003F88CC3D
MNQREEYREKLTELRRHFHRYPELALKEEKTSDFIREYMEKLGYTLTKVPPTGWIAQLPAAKEKKCSLVLRAEMDGLPMEEKTGLSYASVNKGCMHACGHDAILAAALVLAEILAEEQDTFPANVRFLFEPAEEIGEGARRMLAAGALENPKADAFLMFHYATDMTLGMAVHKGQASAMIGGIRIEVHGKSSHWSEAAKGIDSIYAASLVVQRIHELSRTYQGSAPCLVGIGTVHGGEYANIIADHVVLNGNIRAVKEEDFRKLAGRLKDILEETAQETGTEITLEFPKEPVLAFANDPELTEIGARVGRTVFGEKFVLEGEEEVFLSGDNAYRYFQKTKGLFTVFLAAVPGKEHPLHHPGFVLDEEILPYSLETLYQILYSIGEEHTKKQEGRA